MFYDHRVIEVGQWSGSQLERGTRNRTVAGSMLPNVIGCVSDQCYAPIPGACGVCSPCSWGVRWWIETGLIILYRASEHGYPALALYKYGLLLLLLSSSSSSSSLQHKFICQHVRVPGWSATFLITAIITKTPFISQEGVFPITITCHTAIHTLLGVYLFRHGPKLVRLIEGILSTFSPSAKSLKASFDSVNNY